MDIQQKMGKTIFKYIILTALLVLIPGCTLFAKGPGHDNNHYSKVIFPKGAQVGIFLDKKGQITLLDEKGKEVEECQLCTKELEKKYESFCRKAPPDVNLCDGLVDVTVQEMDSIIILRSHKNPHCITFKLNGKTYTIPNPCTH